MKTEKGLDFEIVVTDESVEKIGEDIKGDVSVKPATPDSSMDYVSIMPKEKKDNG